MSHDRLATRRSLNEGRTGIEERLDPDNTDSANFGFSLRRYYIAKACCAGKAVLDAGSGEGYGSRILAETASDVVGVDYDPFIVAHAQRRDGQPRLRFVASDVSALPFADGAFDLVVSFEVVEHLRDQPA